MIFIILREKVIYYGTVTPLFPSWCSVFVKDGQRFGGRKYNSTYLSFFFCRKKGGDSSKRNSNKINKTGTMMNVLTHRLLRLQFFLDKIWYSPKQKGLILPLLSKSFSLTEDEVWMFRVVNRPTSVNRRLYCLVHRSRTLSKVFFRVLHLYTER